ncbi:ABC transporter permease [Eggerthellaceae bacterium 3-80]|nr:ABC transporter permease [bacterium D16-34]
MSAIANYTWRSLGANRVRTAVTIAGVALAAALLTAVLGTYTSLNHYLYQTEEELSGTWMSSVELDPDSEPGEGAVAADVLSEVQAASNVSGVATVQEVGFAALSDKQQDYLGNYAAIMSFTGELESLCAVKPCEGEVPDQPGEILLPESWKTREGTSLGDSITFDVGQRELIMPEGEEDQTVTEESVDLPRVSEIDSDGDVTTTVYKPGMILHAHDAFNSSAEGGIYDEQIINAQKRSYTVVGFYDRSPYAISSAVGQTCLVVDNQPVSNPVAVYLSFSNVSSQDEVESETLALFPDSGITLHTALLRYMGVRSGGSIWDTFFGIASVLAVIIVVACVSLIYNAFAISVAERSGQFGLLASIGASKRQLRRSVLMEAGFVTVVGVPLGLLVGIGGCMVTFAILGPQIASVLSISEVPFEVYIEAWALLFAALLTMVTVLASAFLPALRMSRISAIDAIRQAQTGRVSKRGITDARVCARPGKTWKHKGIAGAVFGVSGQLARINHRRSASKGRAASLSLALAVVLIMTSGSLNVWLGSLVNAAQGSETSDYAISASFEDRRVDGQLMDEYGRAYKSLASVEGVVGQGWNAQVALPALLPEQMVGASLTDGSVFAVAGEYSPGVIGCVASVDFLDDETFDTYVTDLGLDPAQFDSVTTTSAPAVAISQGYGNNGSVYQLLTMLTSTGTVQLAVSAQEGDTTTSNIAVLGEEERRYLQQGEGGSAYPDTQSESASDGNGGTDTVVFAPYYFDDHDSQVFLDPVQTTYSFVDINVVALAEQAPETIGQGSGVVLIMPASAAATLDCKGANPYFRAALNLSPDTQLSADEVAEALEDQMEAAFAELAKKTNPSFYTISNLAEEMKSVTLVATIVNVFCLLFAIILALIALANVFNTITNGLILRRREFAVMKSVGLSAKQFRRMIVCECVGYGLRGLIPGALVSIIVSMFLYAAVAQSLSGMTFSIPWLYVLLAIGMVSVAMALSVAYGMSRCKADNIVEALRRETQ